MGAKGQNEQQQFLAIVFLGKQFWQAANMTSEFDKFVNDSKNLKQLECAVCTEYAITLPIKSCPSCNSVLCPTCLKRLTKCPNCRRNLEDFEQNVFLEHYATEIVFKCKYSTIGCPIDKLTLLNKANHESECQFRSFRCPLVGCNWRGKFDAIIPHALSSIAEHE